MREHLDGLLDLQVVAFVECPSRARRGPAIVPSFATALDAGADVVGGCPHLDLDPDGANESLLDMAGELDRPIDLHTDETLDVAILNLPDSPPPSRQPASRTGSRPATASASACRPSRCRSGSPRTSPAAGVGVITLPQTNLFLQGRDLPVGAPRGLTALRPLLAAGANLAAGADNLQDPFNRMGRARPAGDRRPPRDGRAPATRRGLRRGVLGQPAPRWGCRS